MLNATAMNPTFPASGSYKNKYWNISSDIRNKQFGYEQLDLTGLERVFLIWKQLLSIKSHRIYGQVQALI